MTRCGAFIYFVVLYHSRPHPQVFFPHYHFHTFSLHTASQIVSHGLISDKVWWLASMTSVLCHSRLHPQQVPKQAGAEGDGRQPGVLPGWLAGQQGEEEGSCTSPCAYSDIMFAGIQARIKNRKRDRELD